MALSRAWSALLLALFAVTLVALSPSDALAAGTRALVYTGNGGGYLSSSNTTRLRASLIAAGATGVDYSSSWPGAGLKTTYKLVFIAAPTSTFSTAQATHMRDLIADGGGVILIGEGHGFTAQNNTINNLASQLSVPMRASLSASAASGCGTASSVGSHPLVSGAPNLQMGYAAIVSGGTALYTRSGVFAATSGAVVMVTDTNVWTEPSCNTGSTNNAFFRNLWNLGCSASTWYRDADGDTWGGGTTTSSCTAPPGYVARGGDCNDSNASIYPGATEGVGDEIDQNCDGRETCYVDFDDDGYRIGSTIGSSDLDCRDSGEALASEPAGDCDDRDAATYPGATEVIADGKDQSCDGEEICYEELDGDGYRTSVTTVSADPDCIDSGEALSTVPDGDCDDYDANTYPGAFEVVGDEKDQSCDGTEVCYVDADDDGYRIDDTVTSSDIDCVDTGEATASEPDGDCDDDDPNTYPGAPEIAYDGKDQDCNGEDLCDVDVDGYDAALGSCTGTDCDDTSDVINPGVDEIWYDGTDSDCDGWSDFDADYDRYDSIDYGGDDCDDTDHEVNPGAIEEWYDGVDQDCDGASDFDADGDGYDSSDYGGEDCDDDDDTVYPDAPELDDGIDNDCNGVSEDDDSDGDGIPDEDELDLGTDPFDDDTDGDGVLDGDEVGDDLEDPLDSDDDGTIDALDVDDDGDGILTEDEVGRGDDPLDSDEDGTPDYLDLDSDDDGYLDEVEGDVDTDRDGVPDYLDLDSDDDTVLDADELDEDRDDDGADNRVDPDDDGDGWPTILEETWEPDLDDDGIENYLDPDVDGDGTLDIDEGSGDDDCDGTPNVIDDQDFDGPCAQANALSYQSGACAGASSSTIPAGLAGLFLGLLGLAGVRRRR